MEVAEEGGKGPERAGLQLQFARVFKVLGNALAHEDGHYEVIGSSYKQS
jgi:hypothetical protein